jgi:hypothetical protein
MARRTRRAGTAVVGDIAAQGTGGVDEDIGQGRHRSRPRARGAIEDRLLLPSHTDLRRRGRTEGGPPVPARTRRRSGEPRRAAGVPSLGWTVYVIPTRWTVFQIPSTPGPCQPSDRTRVARIGWVDR